jgi:arabinan endo-1,5-alpha-L-arabinosidase
METFAWVFVHHGGYHYLFVSNDLCCRETKSTYRTMIGARDVTGPYLDAEGKKMIDGGASPLLKANQNWVGPGGESILLQKDEDITVYHAYDAKTRTPSLQISTLTWTDGWPRGALDGDAAQT